MFEFLGALGSIILIDLVLSGDNALVIGAAAAGLQKKQRWYAIALGGGGAIVLRIAFTFGAALLLRLPLLQAIGGILLLLIAIRLLMDRSNTKHTRSARDAETTQEGSPPSMVDAPAKKGFSAHHPGRRCDNEPGQRTGHRRTSCRKSATAGSRFAPQHCILA